MILRALSQQGQTVEEGSVFFRRGPGALVETAQVMSVSDDKMGIPHVRFTLEVTRGAQYPTKEKRTLSLEAFQSRYREKMPVEDM